MMRCFCYLFLWKNVKETQKQNRQFVSQMESRASEVTTRCPHLVSPAPPSHLVLPHCVKVHNAMYLWTKQCICTLYFRLVAMRCPWSFFEAMRHQCFLEIILTKRSEWWSHQMTLPIERNRTSWDVQPQEKVINFGLICCIWSPEIEDSFVWFWCSGMVQRVSRCVWSS